MTDSTTQVQAVAVFGVLLVMALALTLLYVIPAIVVWWKLFKKAGKPGWAAIVPVYNSMVMAEIGDKPVWMGVLAGILGLTGSVVSRSGNSMNTFSPLGSLGSLAGLVLTVMLIMGVAKKFDKSTGFWVAAILLPIVAVFMVNSANYIGTAAATGGPVSTPPSAPVQAPPTGPAATPPASPTPPQTPPQA